MQIGPYQIENPLALAPMVGVTDKFFRRLCRELGAGYVVSEMIASNPVSCFFTARSIAKRTPCGSARLTRAPTSKSVVASTQRPL